MRESPRASHRRRALPGALRAGVLCVILLAGPLAAQEAGSQGQDLYLEVFVNGQPKNLITRFTDLGDGVLSADAEELRNSGILPDAVVAAGEVRLDQIPGLGWRLIEPEQTIRFIVPEELLAPHVVAADAPDPLDEREQAPPVDRGFGLVLNYGLNFEHWRPGHGETAATATGSFDARLFVPWGTLNHGFVLAEDGAGGHEMRRLDSYWRSDFPGRAIQVQLGDVVTRGPGWSRPVRLGGLTVERNFGLRPDLVTVPLPYFEGSAALPSTVEVFSDTIRSYAAEVPAGPFRINDLPLSGGAGLARVVLRDVTGRETQVDMPFLVSQELLRAGMMDFAISAGRPRLGIGSESDRYVDRTFGAATLRAGLTDGLTLLAHAEGGDNLAMAGLGATFRIAHRGTATLSFAQSRTRDRNGSLMDLSTELSLGRTRLSGRIMATQGDFTDIAALSADPDLAEPLLPDFPRHLAQLSLSMPVGVGSTANLFLSDLRHADDWDETSFGASYSTRVWGDSSLTLTALAQRGVRDDAVLSAQLHIPLSRRRDISTSFEHRRGGWRQHVSASGRSERRIPGWNWRLQADRNDQSSIAARAAHDSSLGRVEPAGRLSEDGRGMGLRLDGAIVVAGGGVFMSRRIDDSFAVVDAGAPGVEVSAENRPVGRTGPGGKLLVPDLRAYEANKVSIDPANLPLDAVVAATHHTVRPAHRAGTTIDFGVEASGRAAIVGLVDAQGQPLEVGGGVALNGIDGELLVGFDGEVFATGLKARNEIRVTYPNGRSCTAGFDYVDEPGSLTEMRGVPCL